MAGPRPALAIGDGYASSERGNNNQDLDGSPWSGGSKAGSVSEPEVTPVKKRKSSFQDPVDHADGAHGGVASQAPGVTTSLPKLRLPAIGAARAAKKIKPGELAPDCFQAAAPSHAAPIVPLALPPPQTLDHPEKPGQRSGSEDTGPDGDEADGIHSEESIALAIA